MLLVTQFLSNYLVNIGYHVDMLVVLPHDHCEVLSEDLSVVPSVELLLEAPHHSWEARGQVQVCSAANFLFLQSLQIYKHICICIFTCYIYVLYALHMYLCLL